MPYMGHYHRSLNNICHIWDTIIGDRHIRCPLSDQHQNVGVSVYHTFYILFTEHQKIIKWLL